MFLYIMAAQYDKTPDAYFLAIRGEDFSFSHGLSFAVKDRVRSTMPAMLQLIGNNSL